ncbi:MAG TPA: SDR family oxidoreductase [Sneathiellales bacterium]|nr:SDR family oxidoreductase [Sneathiellales bacterium]
MNKLKNRCALVTGAATGIGAGVAIALAKEGADVAINYLNKKQEKEARAVAAAVRKAGQKAFLIKADVSKEAPVKRMVSAVLKKFGRIDVLVNNAGIATSAPVEDMSVAMWDQMIGINLRSVFLTTHYVLPHMYAAKYGRIVNNASQLASLGSPGLAHYCSAKAGIIGFTRALSLEIGDRNVNANCVAPGATQTPILDAVPDEHIEAIRQNIPKGRLGEVKDIVPAFVFLASEEARHMVGQTVSPNGGDAFF